ncbi:MAG: cell division protein SepF [Candidatus Woesearchaeota archaeon]
MGFLSQIKEKIIGPKYEEVGEEEEDYVHVDTEGEEKAKIVIRPFVLEEFDDIKPVLDSLREGYTVALINIKPLREKDLVELKRAINKLKKTTDALEGEVAGFGDDFIVATPSFATIYRSKQTREVKEERVSE